MNSEIEPKVNYLVFSVLIIGLIALIVVTRDCSLSLYSKSWMTLALSIFMFCFMTIWTLNHLGQNSLFPLFIFIPLLIAGWATSRLRCAVCSENTFTVKVFDNESNIAEENKGFRYVLLVPFVTKSCARCGKDKTTP